MIYLSVLYIFVWTRLMERTEQGIYIDDQGRISDFVSEIELLKKISGETK